MKTDAKIGVVVGIIVVFGCFLGAFLSLPKENKIKINNVEKNISELTSPQSHAIQLVKDIIYVYDAEINTCYAVFLINSDNCKEIKEVPYEKFKDVAIIINAREK